jgi:hypothetical protein
MSYTRPILILLSAVALAGIVASPAAPATSVSKSQRELIIVSPDLSQGNALEQAFFDFVQLNAISLAVATLGTSYNAVHVVKNSSATLNGVANKLESVSSKSSVKAVDVIFVTHGLSSTVVLADNRWPMFLVRDKIINKLSSGERAKLRMLFSTACFGASHRSDWRLAGFKTVSGSSGIYADSAASYVPFLAAWATGSSFAASVSAANTAGELTPSDAAAKTWFIARIPPRPDLAAKVDSHRLKSGSTSLTISTMP